MIQTIFNFFPDVLLRCICIITLYFSFDLVESAINNRYWGTYVRQDLFYLNIPIVSVFFDFFPRALFSVNQIHNHHKWVNDFFYVAVGVLSFIEIFIIEVAQNTIRGVCVCVGSMNIHKRLLPISRLILFD